MGKRASLQIIPLTYHCVKNACTLCAIPLAYRPPRFPPSVSHTTKLIKKVIENNHIDTFNHLINLIAFLYICLIAMQIVGFIFIYVLYLSKSHFSKSVINAYMNVRIIQNQLVKIHVRLLYI